MRVVAPLLISCMMLAPTVWQASHAQTDVAAIIESARQDAREASELKTALNDPDQNVRLAVFEHMLRSEKEATRLMALEAGLGSADTLMRAMAFKALIMKLNAIHVTLAPDTKATSARQEAARKHLDRQGNEMVIQMSSKEPDKGTFRWGTGSGQVSGLLFNVTHGATSVTLSLQDDNTLAGLVRNNQTSFVGTARLL